MNRPAGLAALLGVAALALFAAISPGRPQDCPTSCSRYEDGRCVETEQTCSETAGTAPGTGPSFGAIAYARSSDAWGYSYHWETREKAEEVAKDNCAQHASDCEIVVWFDRKCGAVASTEGGPAFSGLGDKASQARDDARNKCLAAGNTECEVQVSQCSR
jgi:hypothetical protein